MGNEEDNWVIIPEKAHPKAVEFLNEEFLWSIVDEFSPFGNDTGFDTVMHFTIGVWKIPMLVRKYFSINY